MGLSVTLTEVKPTEVFYANITHNLGGMAHHLGIYDVLWRPEENGITVARQLIPHLSAAIIEMRQDPERYKKHDAPNGWGTYERFLPWLRKYLDACIDHPDATVSAWR